MNGKLSKQNDQGKQVGIWIRVSTQDQAESESPEHHERRARYYAESKGWIVREVYHLEAISGKSVMGHAETERMLRDVKSKRISGLIFSKLARLARNTKELLEFSDIFRDHDADLISLQEAIDTSTPAGRLFYTVIAAMTQWEREEIADRVAASVPIRAKLGKPLGGAAPFGYQWKDRQLVPEPKEAPIRKLMYELFLQHRMKRTVAHLLNEAGHRTRNGSKFSGTTIDRLLRDPIAKGQRRANYTKSLGEKKHWKLKPEKEWVVTAVEPVIPEEIWDKCSAILAASNRVGARPVRKTVQLFAGVAFCNCGTRMYVPSKTPKYVCFKCRNKIPVIDLESVFHEQLKNFLLSPEDILSYLNQIDETIKSKQELVASLQSELTRTKAEMDKLMRLYMNSQISGQGFGERNRPLEERKNQLEEQIPALMGELDWLTIQILSSDEVITEAKDLYTRWPQLERNDKRAIIEQTVERITIGKEDIEIELAYLPASSKLLPKTPHMPRDS
ncbi:MAG: recombinase family protein [Pyrinomonadaceae bacterium]